MELRGNNGIRTGKSEAGKDQIKEEKSNKRKERVNEGRKIK